MEFGLWPHSSFCLANHFVVLGLSRTYTLHGAHAPTLGTDTDGAVTHTGALLARVVRHRPVRYSSTVNVRHSPGVMTYIHTVLS